MQRQQFIQGRVVRPQDVALIQDWLEAHPDSTRSRLSCELCLRWNWRNGVGRLKDMAARNLLLKLEAQGLIKLPARRVPPLNGRRNRQVPELEHDRSPIEAPLAALQPVRLELPAPGSADAALLGFLLRRYHYLGHRNCVGENMKYLARDRHGRALACLLFGSAAWKTAARDEWIGWTPQQRAARLLLLANNTRFLIPAWVRVPHLAGHLLGRVASRLSADWQRKYGHPIYLLESFVEPGRFRGECYRAAGWIEVGTTTGRTRNDDGLQPRQPPKSVLLKPLVAEVQRRLRS